MVENGERNISTTKLGEGFVWKTKKPEKMIDDEWEELEMRIVSTIQLCPTDELMYNVMDEVLTAAIWLKLKSQYMSKSFKNKLNLKWKLYGLKMVEGADLAQHTNTFNQLISAMLRININSTMKITR